ncbi:hypothetical protein ACFLZZ_03530 [Nanoarchaeota archaeon]
MGKLDETIQESLFDNIEHDTEMNAKLLALKAKEEEIENLKRTIAEKESLHDLESVSTLKRISDTLLEVREDLYKRDEQYNKIYFDKDNKNLFKRAALDNIIIKTYNEDKTPESEKEDLEEHYAEARSNDIAREKVIKEGGLEEKLEVEVAVDYIKSGNEELLNIYFPCKGKDTGKVLFHNLKKYLSGKVMDCFEEEEGEEGLVHFEEDNVYSKSESNGKKYRDGLKKISVSAFKGKSLNGKVDKLIKDLNSSQPDNFDKANVELIVNTRLYDQTKSEYMEFMDSKSRKAGMLLIPLEKYEKKFKALKIKGKEKRPTKIFINGKPVNATLQRKGIVIEKANAELENHTGNFKINFTGNHNSGIVLTGKGKIERPLTPTYENKNLSFELPIKSSEEHKGYVIFGITESGRKSSYINHSKSSNELLPKDNETFKIEDLKGKIYSANTNGSRKDIPRELMASLVGQKLEEKEQVYFVAEVSENKSGKSYKVVNSLPMLGHETYENGNKEISLENLEHNINILNYLNKEGKDLTFVVGKAFEKSNRLPFGVKDYWYTVVGKGNEAVFKCEDLVYEHTFNEDPDKFLSFNGSGIKGLVDRLKERGLKNNSRVRYKLLKERDNKNRLQYEVQIV